MKKERISVSILPHEKEVIEKLAYFRGVSSSRVIGELISTSFEALERLCGIMEIANRADVTFRHGMREVISEVADDVTIMYQDALDQLQDVETGLQKKEQEH